MKFNIKDTEFKIKDTPFENLARIGNIYIASILSEKGVSYLKEKGVSTFIDFKAEDEVEIDESKLVEAVGGEYINTPIYAAADLELPFLKKIDKILNKNNEPKLLYCKSGNRVIALIFIMLILIEKMPMQDVIDYTRKFPFFREETRDTLIDLIQSIY